MQSVDEMVLPAGSAGSSSDDPARAVQLPRTVSTSRALFLRTVSIAAWFGLLTGLIEGSILFALIGVPGFAIRVSPEILWIAPAFNLILFSSVGFIFALVSLVMPKKLDLKWAVGLFSAITVFCLFLIAGIIHQIAAILLSFGIGYQIARWVGKHHSRFLTFFRKGALPLLAAAVIIGCVGASWNYTRERYLINQLPEPKKDLPNVLLITLDTLRPDHLSAYGYSRATSPNLKSFAERGVLFQNAFSNSSWTLPSHASLFTGRQASEHGADWLQPLDNRFPTLAEVLSKQGYLTGGFAANTAYVGPEWGIARGFTRFQVHGSSLAGDATGTVYGKKLAVTLLPRLGYFNIPGRKTATQVNAEFFDWLDDASGRPFFAFLNYFDLHDPYLSAGPLANNFSKRVTRGDVINFQFQPTTFRRKPVVTAEEIQTEIDSYDECIANLDAKLGDLFAELEKRGLASNTLVIVTSDHGEAFGEHDLFGHGNSLYLESIRVPLIIVWPGKVPAGKQVADVIGLQSIPATVLDLLGERIEPFPHNSLVGFWSDDVKKSQVGPVLSDLQPGRFKDGPANYPTTKGRLQSLVNQQWHFILSENDQAELYAWREDPGEKRNLADTEHGKKIVDEFRKRLTALSAAQQTLR